MTVTAQPYRTPTDDEELRVAVCQWLDANGIDPAVVPGDEKPDCTYRQDGFTPGGDTITTRVKVQISAHRQRDVIRHGANRIEQATVTVPMKVPPPPIVQAWLDSRCPTCQR